MKRLIKYLFNSEVGYFAERIKYDSDGVPYIGYLLYRKYRWFGIPCTKRIAVCVDYEHLLNTLKRFNLKLK